MATELKLQKIKRKVIKGSVTRFETYLNSITAAVDELELVTRKSKFELLWNEFSDVQLQIDMLEEVGEDDELCEERDKFETKYFQLINRVEKLLQNSTTSTSSSMSDSTSNSISTSRNRVRLPEVKLPKFAGAYEEWYTFCNTFTSLIHANQDLNKIQKLQYLKSALDGEAAGILVSIEMSEENYDDAWELLRDRYDNKRLIITKHIQAIFDLPVMTKESHTFLRQIRDGLIKHTRLLKSLSCPVEHWDDLLIVTITNKLDGSTIKEWESTLSKNTLPNIKQLTDFLASRCDILEAVGRKQSTQSNAGQKPVHPPTGKQGKKVSMHTVSPNPSCFFCNEEHSIYNCDKFLELSIENRLKEAKGSNLCINCLHKGHNVGRCRSGGCRKCKKRHNTLLHFEQVAQPVPSISNHTSHSSVNSEIILSTAVISIASKSGQYEQCRALLDSGSQSCFITDNLVRRLKLSRESIHIPVLGISKNSTIISERVDAQIKSTHNSFSAMLKCLVLPNITAAIPLQTFNKSSLNIPQNIKLADPNFNISAPIDLLIGAELFYDILCIGQIKLTKGGPTLQKSNLGWIISGPHQTNIQRCHHTISNFSAEDSLNERLTTFWSIEEDSKLPNMSPEDLQCEKSFISTVQQNAEGRFIVRLPFKTNPQFSLGDSRHQAVKRFYSLERKLSKDAELKKDYSAFIQEYIDLGHMKVLSNNLISNNAASFFLPHHAVLKQTSLTTKLRVVFDGSARSSNGVSLNDLLLPGPVLQDDLFAILCRFRTHKYVVTADIAKMYRQVLIHDDDAKFQRILWRDHPNEELRTYQLSTVTYGTTSASFLAIRALRQLAHQEANNFPTGSKITLQDFYVDDLLTGAHTLEELKLIQAEVSSMLQRGGFELRKWSSNCLNAFTTASNLQHSILSLDKDQDVSTLGLQWNPQHDIFKFSKPSYKMSPRVTKRKILSNIAKIFDPLGFIGPAIVLAKLIMQELWQLKTNWDESVSTSIHTKWTQFESELHHLSRLNIPRWIRCHMQSSHLEIHGFSDASEQAYGACIYLRATNDSTHYVELLCAKSRVAPLKNISLPKLELCGALLLARLMDKVIRAIKLDIDKIYYWTDSTINLAWIKATARTWKTFVANRVGEIHNLSSPSDWFHVATSDNPADIISRGSSISSLIDNELWWKGPPWLLHDQSQFPGQPDLSAMDITLPEKRIVISNVCTDNNELFSKFSSFQKLIRVVAYCHRFVTNSKAKIDGTDLSSGPLSTSELQFSTNSIIKIVQAASFSPELSNLQKNMVVPSKSPLRCLNPFIDDSGICRVGGRLKNAPIPFSNKHPIILPKGHPFVKLLIEYEHKGNFHAGAQSTLAAIRRHYWPLGIRSSIRNTIRKCVTCFKVNPKIEQPLMGDLPVHRVSPSRPFSTVGVDYFGPMLIREGKHRNRKLVKAYGALFICFVTKAIHIELATDLSTETFLAAMKRFIARRGKPATIWSDNGTNFTGAQRELQQLADMFQKQNSRNKIISAMSSQSIEWKFIPPRSPHFGGLWEAGVKSVKFHLRRVIGNAAITYEEMYSVLVQIEAILNSRPLTPLSDDPNDLSYLTPGHFLIGDSLTSLAEPTILDVQLNRLSRWQYVERLRQHFWSRWSREYLSQLQERRKWTSKEPSCLQVGRLVLLREDNTPPVMWPIGRILATHPGADGVVRAATVKTVKGELKRASVKLCVLPIEC